MALPRNYFKPGMTLKADDLNDIARRIRALQQKILGDSEPSPEECPAWIPEEQSNVTEPWCTEFFRSTYKTDGEVVPYVFGGEVITNMAIDANGEAHFVYTKPFEEDWVECQDFEFEDNGPDAPTPPVFVWLECTGDEPEVVDINFGDYYPPETFGYTKEDVQSGKKLEYPHGIAVRQGKLRWRVTAKPREDALRVWPLSVIHYDDEEPITQLLWGDLSMLEINGIKDINGRPLFPGENNPTGERFFDKNYGQGMAPLCDIDFSVGNSRLQGTLKGRIDDKAALELFLANDFNPYEENRAYNPGNVDNDDDWDDPNNLEIPDDFYDPADPPPPSPPSEDPEDPNDPHNTGKHSTSVKKYAYIGGVGFSETEVKIGDRRYEFHLKVKPHYLEELAKNLPVLGTITFEANGVTPGYYADVEMGIKKGTCSAQAGTGNITASHEIEFHGTNNADVSLKKEKLSTNILSNPVDVDIASEIILASTLKYQTSDWVQITKLSLEEVEGKGIYAEEGLFRGYYRVDLNEEYILKRLRKHWYTYLKQIKISGSTESEQEGVVVKTTLTGDMIDSETKTTFA